MACFVTGSPMIEQLQPRGGTEKVFRMTVGIMDACYSPSPSGRKQRPCFWFYLTRIIHDGSWRNGGVARDKREERDLRDV